MKTRPTLYITRAAIIAGLYAALTYAFFFMSYNSVQFRISEALTILPLIFPESIAGLFVGCIIANIFNGPIDMTLGSAASLLAACMTFIIGLFVRRHSLRAILGAVPPVLVNAFIVPFIILLVVPEYSLGYWLDFAFVGLGQLTVVALLGVPLYFLLIKLYKKTPSLFAGSMLDRNSISFANNPVAEPDENAQ